MKMKRLLAVLLAFAMAAAMLLTACDSGSETVTLESFINSDEELKEEFDNAVTEAEARGIQLVVSGNDIIYNYDLKDHEDLKDVDEEYIRSDEAKAAFDAAIEEQADNLTAAASSLSEQTEIEGIQMIVNYYYGDDLIFSRTFTAEEVEEAGESE